MTDNAEILRLRRTKVTLDRAKMRAHYRAHYHDTPEHMAKMRVIRSAELAAVAAHSYSPPIERQPIQARPVSSLGLAVGSLLLD